MAPSGDAERYGMLLEPTNEQDACDHGFPPPLLPAATTVPRGLWQRTLVVASNLLEDGDLPGQDNDCGVGA